MASLGNQDFRRFLDESRPSAAQKQKPKKKKKDKPAPSKRPDAEDPDEPKYRDRADERRRGLTIDDDDAAKYLTAEETQYLGGSVGRTHLVRGLDRVLLSRVRGDASATTADGDGDADDVVVPPRAAAAAPQRARLAPPRAAAAAAAAAAPPFPEKFETAAGRAIATAALRPPAVSCAELFQPRRMAFVYALGEDADADAASDSDDDFPGGGGGDKGVLAIPETLLRSRAECPEPPEGMNAAADAAVLREVAGIVAALHVGGNKDRKKGKGAEEQAQEAAQQKERHLLKLRLIENPSLAAAAAAPKPKAAAEASTKGKDAAAAKGAAPVASKAKKADSGDSGGMFDDVDDAYQVDTSRLKQKAQQKATGKGKYFDKGDTMRDLPAVAQHGNARGNDIRNGAAAQASRQHGYPHPRRQQLEQERQQQQQQHHEQEGGYGQYAGYYDEYGQWHAQAYNPQQQSNGGGWDQVGGYGGYAGGVAPPKPPKPEPKVAKGKGFSMKMGDRAHVAQSFTLEQRQAREGKGVVGAAEAADEYGADILLGAGGMEDEEEDLRAMEGAAKTLNRADFETDEQFQAYKAKKEAAPKAAFQFGVKVQDGRRNHKQLKDSTKLSSELRKMQGMHVQRDGRDVDMSRFDSAFRDGGGGGGGGAPDATPMRKKPRIQGL